MNDSTPTRRAESTRTRMRVSLTLALTALIAVFGENGPVCAANAPDATGTITTDLLIVGGTESGWAAAIQAARMGVRSITLVNDIEWLGGQFTAESVCAIDENRGVDKKVPFPRSGLFKELTDRIEAFNFDKYGHKQPGNAWTARTTVRPAEAEAIFRKMLQPYINSGQVRLISHYYPVAATLGDDGTTLQAVRFTSTDSARLGLRRRNSAANDRADRDSGKGDKPPLGGQADFIVRPRITIDASDFGEVIQACGAAFEYGPDLKNKYHEPSAPTDRKKYPLTDMNPITWCVVIEETDQYRPIDKPAHYDQRRYYLTTSVTKQDYLDLHWPHRPHRPFNPPWSLKTGKFYQGDRTVYSQRRLIDHYNHKLKRDHPDVILLNWSVQDYPLDVLPTHVVETLEKTELGASKKNIVVMTRRQRQIVFDDARRHSLGMLYHLQTTVHERMSDKSHSFRRFKLSEEFGTPDRLPPKPYIRESLRLRAMHMMREQDTRFSNAGGHFANAMYYDGLACWQFVYDFHPTGRAFLPQEDGGKAWEIYIKPGRSWGTISKRSLFPLRSLIPEKVDGLLGAQKNLGYSSIVSSAVRLHDHSIAIGQAGGATAAICLKHDVRPRTMPVNPALLAEVRSALCSRLDRGEPLMLWPYRDLEPDHAAFIAANQLAVRAIWTADPTEQDFRPKRLLTRQELARAITRAALGTGHQQKFSYAVNENDRRFSDVDFFDQAYAAIESLARWKLLPATKRFRPLEPAKVGLLREILGKLGWKQHTSAADDSAKLTRARFALELWQAIESLPDKTFPVDGKNHFRPGNDSDGDGITDLDDPLPFDRDNDSLPDRLDPDHGNDGLADRIGLRFLATRQFNFTGKGSKPVNGYINDVGLRYDQMRGFGWSKDISNNHRRRRGRNTDRTRDTFLFTRRLATWECDVENGLYRVTICIGDSAFEQSGQRVIVEGVVAAKDRHTDIGQFYERAVMANVTDGRLTIEIGTDNPRLNTCLNWLRLQRVGQSQRPGGN